MGSVTVIYDTNTLISAYGFGGKPESCIKIGFHDAVEVAVSPPIIDEYERVLGYEHLPFTEEEQAELIPEFELLTGATLVEPELSLDVVDDADDDKFVELAVEVDADYIISGDSHLTELNEFRGTEVCTPHEFIEAVDWDPPETPLRSE